MANLKPCLKRNHTHKPGYASLAAEVITIAYLDFKRGRLSEESVSAAKDNREYANFVASKEKQQLLWFLFGGGMDLLIELADLNVNPDRIRQELKK